VNNTGTKKGNILK